MLGLIMLGTEYLSYVYENETLKEEIKGLNSLIEEY